MKYQIDSLDGGKLIVNRHFQRCLEFNNIKTADDLFGLEGVIVKKILAERGTERVMLKNYKDNGVTEVEMYLKRYASTPLKERFKGIVSFKKTNFNAYDEWNSIMAFHEHNLPTMKPVALASDGKNCCILTLGITEYRKASIIFEELQEQEKNAQNEMELEKIRQKKSTLISQIADYVGRMHAAGMAHQDLYLVHFFVKEHENMQPYLIDLQRCLVRKKVAWRWRVKDLGQLLFASNKFLSNSDKVFFWEIYTALAGYKFFKNRRLINAIRRKANRILEREQRKQRDIKNKS
ncbi:lipopolysaccharide kinase InaA family protein [Lentisphaerota bacterium WC36G]|nr:hypothetical protein LJT99_01555 [Lentisphaerae bacterium WC36]